MGRERILRILSSCDLTPDPFSLPPEFLISNTNPKRQRGKRLAKTRESLPSLTLRVNIAPSWPETNARKRGRARKVARVVSMRSALPRAGLDWRVALMP